MSRLFARAGYWKRALLVTLLLWTTTTTAARAQNAIDLSDLHGSLSVTPQASAYTDQTGALTFTQVSAPSFASKLKTTGRELALGLTSAPLWLAFHADNPTEKHKSWLLELSYPHLDSVQLYVVRAGGELERYETGDMRPFAQRPVAQPNFLFPLENKPHERTTIYLRVATTGTLSLPLHAWDVGEYLEHQGQTRSALWMFLGALLMMALYNVAVFALIRQSEYLTQALLLVAMCATIFTFNGLMFQYVLPNQPVLANKSIFFFMTLALGACTLTCALVGRSVEGAVYRRYERAFKAASWLALVGALVQLIVPKEVSLRLAIVLALTYMVAGVLALLRFSRDKHPQLRLYVLSWYFPIAGVPITLLSNIGVLPPWPPFSWAAYLGCAMQAVFTSLALAARVKLLGDHLAGLNSMLSSNVVSLEAALESAKHANEAARRAGRAKDEFLATMSHELRTPLNAIINVPQGLLESFVERSIATCSRCGTEFTLETGDRIDATTRCQECQTVGSLVMAQVTDYVGAPAETARFLRKIERAGHHLLDMVDGVLDFSKMEAGRLELHVSELDLCGLVNDVVDAMSEPARLKQLRFKVELPATPLLREADAVRLKQVLLNLVSNAIKFSEQSGTITISVVRDEVDRADVICVRDQGIGIAAEHHERIFAGFEQVHMGSNRKYGGTGLGLPISRNLVRMHGGELSVESALGAGSTFIVRLPGQPSAALRTPPAPVA